MDNNLLHWQDLYDCDSGIFSVPTLTSPLARYTVVLDIVPPANGKLPCKRLSLVTLQTLLLKPGGTTAAAAAAAAAAHTLSPQPNERAPVSQAAAGRLHKSAFDDV